MALFPKMFGSSSIILIVILIILVAFYFIYGFYNQEEGFWAYPVDDRRINFGKEGKRRYNDYADMIDIEKVSVIPNGAAGDPVMNKLLNTPSYEGDKNSLTQGALSFANELTYKTPPVVGGLLARIQKCESVKTWDCEALEDPEFLSYCGICTKDGQDHLGNKQVGGLYIDPEVKRIEIAAAAAAGRVPDFMPTTGICKGEFIGLRPYCDVQKDRFECSQAQDFNNDAARTKCALCAFNPGSNLFVYTGSRGNIDTRYALKGNPVYFPARLRFAVTHPAEAVITVTRNSDQKKYIGSYIPNTNVYLTDIPECTENELFNIVVKYPEYAPVGWTDEDKKRIATISSPKSAALVRASYGPLQGGDDAFLKDDPRAVDVSDYLRSKFKMKDCSQTAVRATNDSLGGDPNPGIFKQLRLTYSDNGTDFAYAYTTEGGTSAPVNTALFNTLCPIPVPRSDAERLACETNANGDTIPGRVYTQGRNQSYYGAGSAYCIQEAEQQNRGIVGIWESMGRVPRQVPLDISVTRINGYEIGDDGVHTMGTIKGSKYFKSIPLSKIPGIPSNLFWFWSKKTKLTTCDIQIAVPATLRDPTIAEDLKLCPAGPLISTPTGATRLNQGACQKIVNGKAQEPGTFTDECIRSLFLASGCQKVGKAFPNNPEKVAKFTVDSITTKFNNIDDITEKINDIYTVSTTGENVDGLKVEQESYARANMDCFGVVITNPCDTAFKETGPHTPACLDYLFRDAGKTNPNIGSTYTGVFNRSSGTDRTDKTPIMYCQRTGSLAPIGKDGEVNNDAITTANSYGSVRAVKEFYKQIHYDANFNSEPTKQQVALNQCYGVGVKNEQPICKGTKAKYVRIRPALQSDNNIQISQLEVYNVAGKIVSMKKPTRSTKSLGAAASNAVDGRSNPHVYPDLFISENDISPNKSDIYWEVNLGNTEEVAYVVYTNAGGNDPRTPTRRSIGMRVQLVDENESVVRQELLKGGDQETVMFSNAKPAGILKAGDNISFIPGKYLGSALTTVAGGETLIKPMAGANPVYRNFTVVAGNSPGGAVSFKQTGTNSFLRVQGFRIRLAFDDGTQAFKNESSFNISDSLSGSPGEVSYESVSTPGSYLAVSDNMGVYISQASGASQKKACSWATRAP